MTTDQVTDQSYLRLEGETDAAEERLRQLRALPAAERAKVEERIVRSHMPLARRIAACFAGRGVPVEDLEQVAYLGLVKAVRRFDPELGTPFVSFASVTIRGHVRRHFRDCGWAIRPPRPLQELQAKVWAARDDLTASLGRPPTVREVASTVGADVKEIDEALALREFFTVCHLDAPAHESGSLSVGDRVAVRDSGFERIDAVLSMRDAIKALKERDRQILCLRFFEGLTQKEIGDRLGVTQMQVSRLLARILRDLRRAMDRPMTA